MNDIGFRPRLAVAQRIAFRARDDGGFIQAGNSAGGRCGQHTHTDVKVGGGDVIAAENWEEESVDT